MCVSVLECLEESYGLSGELRLLRCVVYIVFSVLIVCVCVGAGFCQFQGITFESRAHKQVFMLYDFAQISSPLLSSSCLLDGQPCNLT